MDRRHLLLVFFIIRFLLFFIATGFLKKYDNYFCLQFLTGI